MIPSDWAAARGAQKFVKGSSGRGLDLRSADLSDIRLERVDLTGADLRETDLEDFRALDCKFEGANFVGSALKGAKFFDCVLANANFANCLMRGTMLSACHLMGSNLLSADLREADALGSAFDRCNLLNADLRSIGAKQASFDDADLANTDLRSGNFERASFRGAKLTGARWDRASLKGARFDPGSGHRMLTEAIGSLPERDTAAYAALACREGKLHWYSIERRATREEVLRIQEPVADAQQLVLTLEHLDQSLTPISCYALVVEHMLGSLLIGKYAPELALTFIDERTQLAFHLPH